VTRGGLKNRLQHLQREMQRAKGHTSKLLYIAKEADQSKTMDKKGVDSTIHLLNEMTNGVNTELENIVNVIESLISQLD
jgi:hypothetical protein